MTLKLNRTFFRYYELLDQFFAFDNDYFLKYLFLKEGINLKGYCEEIPSEDIVNSFKYSVCKLGYSGLVKELIKSDKDYSYIHILAACESGDKKTIDYFFKKKFVELKNNQPVILALMKNYPSRVEDVVNNPEKYGFTCWDIVVFASKQNVVEPIKKYHSYLYYKDLVDLMYNAKYEKSYKVLNWILKNCELDRSEKIRFSQVRSFQ